MHWVMNWYDWWIGCTYTRSSIITCIALLLGIFGLLCVHVMMAINFLFGALLLVRVPVVVSLLVVYMPISFGRRKMWNEYVMYFVLALFCLMAGQKREKIENLAVPLLLLYNATHSKPLFLCYFLFINFLVLCSCIISVSIGFHGDLYACIHKGEKEMGKRHCFYSGFRAKEKAKSNFRLFMFYSWQFCLHAYFMSFNTVGFQV